MRRNPALTDRRRALPGRGKTTGCVGSFRAEARSLVTTDQRRALPYEPDMLAFPCGEAVLHALPKGSRARGPTGAARPYCASDRLPNGCSGAKITLKPTLAELVGKSTAAPTCAALCTGTKTTRLRDGRRRPQRPLGHPAFRQMPTTLEVVLTSPVMIPRRRSSQALRALVFRSMNSSWR